MSAMPSIFHYRYAGEAGGPRYEMWREEFGRRWIAADFEPIGTDHVDNQFSGTEHSFLALCKMRSTPVRIDRRSGPVDNAAGCRYLLIAAGSRLEARQCGRSIDLSFGQMTLVSADEPAQVSQLTAGDRWSIRISRKLLDDCRRDVDDKIVRLIDAGSELANLILHQIETAHRLGPKVDASANHAIAQHILDLVGLCLGANGDAAQVARHRGLAAARLEAIKADILQHLGSPDLELGQIAARHGLSARYVQHLFGLTDESFSGFVLEQRLLAAHRLLREPRNRSRKISDIAAAAGFSDISYFNRAFRGRFDATPTDVRVTGGQQVP
jgi:AraC-like DNA-binding protein